MAIKCIIFIKYLYCFLMLNVYGPHLVWAPNGTFLKSTTYILPCKSHVLIFYTF